MNTWLDEHLETFVRPYLGYIPNLKDKPSKKSGHADWSEILTNEAFYLLYLAWQEAKSRAAGRPILLPGRDVWLLEVIARCEGGNYPTVFRPSYRPSALASTASTTLGRTTTSWIQATAAVVPRQWACLSA
jgi:hypothetical protein